MDDIYKEIYRDQLIERLREVQTHAHYAYALWCGLPKENLFVRRLYDAAADMSVEDEEESLFTIEEFFAKVDTMHPKDTFDMRLLMRKPEEMIDSCWEHYDFIGQYDGDEDFLPDKVLKDVCGFLEFYCERRQRENSPFYLTPDTVHRFKFTKEDLEILAPIVDRCNREAKVRIRKEYDALAGLDFIRNKEKV